MGAGGQRIDKWLFFARLTKTRGLAQDVVQSGLVRLNREKIDQPAKTVRPGDVLTLSLNGRVRVLKIRAPGLRRGPPSEAATLYDDLSADRAPMVADCGASGGQSGDEADSDTIDRTAGIDPRDV